jgi:Fe-S-cluster-containing hydrogenase component 2
VEAISWRKKEPAVLNRDKCIRCKACIRACKFKAIH